jgi:hypothetical protein
LNDDTHNDLDQAQLSAAKLYNVSENQSNVRVEVRELHETILVDQGGGSASVSKSQSLSSLTEKFLTR